MRAPPFGHHTPKPAFGQQRSRGYNGPEVRIACTQKGKGTPVKRQRIVCIAAIALTIGFGFLIHFLYEWSPNVLFALFSPVRESVWEHMKLIYWPLLLAGLILTRRDRTRRGSWYLAVLVCSALLLVFGWLVNIRAGLISMPVDIGCFLVLILLGFAIAHWITVGERWHGLLLAGVVLLGALVVLLSFFWPEGILFADLSLVDALYTLPC